MSLAGLPGRPHGHRETLPRYCSALPEVGERGPHVLVEFDGGRHQQVELPVRQPLGLRDPVEFDRTHLTE